jgi:hypothetical protein
MRERSNLGTIVTLTVALLLVVAAMVYLRRYTVQAPAEAHVPQALETFTADDGSRGERVPETRLKGLRCGGLLGPAGNRCCLRAARPMASTATRGSTICGEP